ESAADTVLSSMLEVFGLSGKSPQSALCSEIGTCSFDNSKRPSWPTTLCQEIASDSRSVLRNAAGSRIAVAPVSSPTWKVLCGYLPQDTNHVAGSECNGWRDHGELEVLSLAAFRCT